MAKASQTSSKKSTPSIQHPLEPLTAEEITTAVAILRSGQPLGERVRFISVSLKEPEKAQVLAYQPGDTVEREVFIVLLDKAAGATYEAVISLTMGQIKSWRHLPGVQPAVMGEEAIACEGVVKAHPAFQEALRKRGITNLDGVMIDNWTVGNYGSEDEQNRRLLRSLVYLRPHAHENVYAYPVEGIEVFTDLNTLEVISVEDHGILPVPSEAGNFSTEAVGHLRDDLKPLDITQPEGPSFTVQGHEIRWQKWQLRIGFNAREGLVLYTVGYEDQGRVRPVLYRASLAELVVPYGDPGFGHYRKTAFDVGEYGIGTLANALKLGCDCLGHIHYFDAFLSDSLGKVLHLPNAICLHEEDHGILWKHHEWFTDKTEVRRSRRLVLSFFSTIDNYDYGFFWYFYQDGTIEFEAKLTGILSTSALAPGETSKYGQMVAPQLNAPIHQHIFCFRLDMTVDGPQNSIYETHAEAEPSGATNPHGNAFFMKSTLITTEAEAQQLVDPTVARSWKIVNPAKRNRLGEPVGYQLLPGENTLPFLQPESPILKRAGFIAKHFWATPYHPDERYPAGDYPNQHPGGEGLPAWTRANRSLENTDLVVWYIMNVHHLPRPEEWPVMPVVSPGFQLKPAGFFERNPALDVPPPYAHEKTCQE